jgi:hypothetical protein
MPKHDNEPMPPPGQEPMLDPENVRFYHSGAELPSFDRVPDARPAPPEEETLSVHRGSSPEPEELRLVRARVYRRSPNPMQAGRAKISQWIVEFEPHLKPGIDPLMGWTSSADPLQQVRMAFNTLEEAEGYCRRQKLAYEVEQPAAHKPQQKSYTTNFLPFEDGTPKPIYPH